MVVSSSSAPFTPPSSPPSSYGLSQGQEQGLQHPLANNNNHNDPATGTVPPHSPNSTRRTPTGRSITKKAASPLVSSCRYLLQPNGSINGDDVATAILPNFPDLVSALPVTDNFANYPALKGVDGFKKSLTHVRIRDFIMKELGPQLHQLGCGRGDRIALVLPNGPELGLAILGIAQWASCLPLNANGASSELKKDLQAARASMVIAMADDSAAIQDMARALNITFCGLKASDTEVGIFSILPMWTNFATKYFQSHVDTIADDSDNGGDNCCAPSVDCVGSTVTESDMAIFRNRSVGMADKEGAGSKFLSNDHDNEVLVLFTSGTTGNKKLVPHQLGDMLIAAACIAVSWNLSPDDVCCNSMPLFHVGGIVRQIFAPILSAGSVICCPAFDPDLFWSLLLSGTSASSPQGNQHPQIVPTTKTTITSQLQPQQPAFTWYYAAPTMHQVILRSRPQQHSSQPQPKLRMIANAAGGLLPSLAQELRDVFGANVLPSYGMTECMPISSPPADYKLEKPGTSGVAVGPQITIFSARNFEQLPHGMEGNICVRGRPCFHGYGGTKRSESFLEGGWFNTGDLGYLDEDGYLYITGRSKEVINRGGEIISPLEVEEEVSKHPLISACLAFAANHDVLQEIVAIVVVPKPNIPRVDLPTLHSFLQERLTPAKWPQCMVYMDALPKSHTNKLLRVKLGQRLNLPSMNDGMFPVEKTFEAICPPQGTPVGVSIPSQSVTIDIYFIQEVLQQEFGVIVTEDINEPDYAVVDLLNDEVKNQGGNSDNDPNKQQAQQRPSQNLLVTPHPTRVGGIVVHVSNLGRVDVIKKAKDCLDAFLQPSHVIEYNHPISADKLKMEPDPTDAVSSIMSRTILFADPMVEELQELIEDLLDLDCVPGPETNFFHVGGSSLLASQLASKLRKKYSVSFSGAEIFRHNTCIAMARKIQSQKPEYSKSVLSDGGEDSHTSGTSARVAAFASGGICGINPQDHSKDGVGGGCTVDLQGVPLESKRLEPENNFFTALFQLIPLFGVFPVWQFSRFFLFFMSLLWMLNFIPGETNLFAFMGTLVVYHFLWVSITPLIFVLIKWIVIGRYKAGRYPCFSAYYLRWWFVDVTRKVFGMGIYGSSFDLRVFFYRLLGANIGSHVQITLEADVAEFDLVSIGDNSVIEYGSVRGFGVDNGAIILGPVTVGDNCSVGIRSVVAPNTTVPSGSHVGPASSSYEITQDDRHVRYNRCAVPEPNFWMRTFVAGPILGLVDTFSHIPAMYILYLMVLVHSDQAESFRDIGDLMEWLCHPKRIPYYIGIRIARALLAPFFYMFAALVSSVVFRSRR